MDTIFHYDLGGLPSIQLGNYDSRVQMLIFFANKDNDMEIKRLTPIETVCIYEQLKDLYGEL